MEKKTIILLGHEEVAKLLISHGADVSIVDNYQTTAAGWARSRGKMSTYFILNEQTIENIPLKTFNLFH